MIVLSKIALQLQALIRAQFSADVYNIYCNFCHSQDKYQVLQDCVSLVYVRQLS